jgi:membrane protease YdiL (CAAX protease family)
METTDQSPPEPTVAPARAPRRSYFREVPWRWSDVLIASAPIIVNRLWPQLLYGLPQWLRYALYLLTFGWMLVFPLGVARRRLGRWPKLPARRVVLVESLIALPAAVLALTNFILTPLVLVRLFGETEMPPSPFEPIVRSPDRFEFLRFMIVAVVVAPLSEEVFFRGLLYNALRQKLHVMAAMLLQAVVFGFYHPFGAVFSSAIALGSLGIAAVYDWRKTLLATILLHAMVNSIGLLLITLSSTADANAPRLGMYGSAHNGGCLVTQVVPDSAAEKAGLQTGDVVVTVDGKPVTDIPSIFRIIRTKHLGDTVVVEFLRGGKTDRVEAVLQALRP